MKISKHLENGSNVRVLLSIGLLICSFHMPVQAQQPSTIIMGTVTDQQGPLAGTNVVEIDATNRINAAVSTDMNGHFSIKLKGRNDKLKFTFVGYKTVILPIGNRTVFNVVMEENTTLREITVTAKTKVASGGLDIPEREQSFSQQTINMKEFEGLAFTSVDEALQGRIAGLDIVMSSGNLGSGTSMRLRGSASINANTEPLIVIDGNVFETDKNNNVDYSAITDEKFAELLSINPEDIQSITVLKDAAATAIWGSQGANGVISVVTKRGTRSKPKLTYSLREKSTSQPQGYQLLNGDQYTMLMKEAFFNTSQVSVSVNELNYDQNFSEYEQFNNNTDWRKAVSQHGLNQTHYLAISGGGDKAVYRISGGYDNQVGSIIGQQLDRFSNRTALDYFVSDRIKISSSFALTYTKNQKNSDALLAIAYKKMPNLAIFEEDANGNSTGAYYRMLQWNSSTKDMLSAQRNYVNPVASAYLAKNEEHSYNITPQFDFNYKLLGTENQATQLNYTGTVVMSIYNQNDYSYYPSELNSATWNQTASGINNSNSDFSESVGFTTRHQLVFNPHLNNPNHSLSFFLSGQLTTGTSSSQDISAFLLPSGTITSPAEASHLNNTTSGSGNWRSVYYTFSSHYSYLSKYSADFSVRRDGSTKFGPSHRWGTFPALSGRWNIIDEEWMKDTKKWLSMLSFRPGWGIVGNQPSRDNTHYSVYGTDGKYLNITGMSPTNIRLTDLRWEKSVTWNLGTDIGFFNDMLTTEINVYTKNTHDLLMANPAIPTSTGYSSLLYKNGGSIRNEGYEVNLNINKVKIVGELFGGLNLTFAKNQNTITQMDDVTLATINGKTNTVPTNGTYLTRVQLNNPFGAIYGLKYNGVYAYSYDNWEEAIKTGATCPFEHDKSNNVVFGSNGKPMPMYYDYDNTKYAFTGGDAIYEDVNHDGNINKYDIVYLGSSLPKLTGGFGFRLFYRRVSMNAQFNYRYGNKIINKARMLAECMYTTDNQSTAVNYRWRKEGDGADGSMVIPRALYGAGYNWLGSDRYVEDGSFIRLNNLQISYSLKPELLKVIGFSQLSLYVSADNVFCLTKYTGVDPEVSYGGYGVVTDNATTPRARSYTLGITTTF
ncbi:MAG: SusC/RagA family TonB-linked outer membrane protein [Bacteroidota bacterium]|nr:SusC/RagA family TonB-linked outer membrane protein [Bacteroidota bacterium]